MFEGARVRLVWCGLSHVVLSSNTESSPRPSAFFSEMLSGVKTVPFCTTCVLCHVGLVFVDTSPLIFSPLSFDVLSSLPLTVSTTSFFPGVLTVQTGLPN